MQYQQQIILNIPFSIMIDLFENPDNLKKWQPDVVSFRPISGTIGQPGAVSELTVDMKVKHITMKETIIKRDLPDEFVIFYEADGVTNTVTNRFKELGDKQTQWIMENDYQFKGLLKYAALAMKGIFKKQTQVTMERFKKFSEGLSDESNIW